MAITFGGSGGTVSNSTTTLTVSGIVDSEFLAVGQMLLFVVSKSDANDVEDIPDGFTLIFTTTSHTNLQTFYKILDAGDIAADSWTFSWTSACRASADFFIIRSGFEPSAPFSFVKDGTHDDVTGFTMSGSSLTPARTGSVIFFGQTSRQNTALISDTDFTMASNTWSVELGGGSNNTTLNTASYVGFLGSNTATGNFSVAGGDSTADWSFQVFLINPTDPTIIRSYEITDTSNADIGTQVQNVPFDIKITALNGIGDTVTGFNDTVTLSSTGILTEGAGETPSFTSGVLSSLEVTINSIGTFTISVDHTDDDIDATGISNDFFVGGVLDFQQDATPIAFPVKVLPTLSTVKHINIFMLPNFDLENGFILGKDISGHAWEVTGEELVLDGGFSGDGSGWDLFEWDIEAGVATYIGADPTEDGNGVTNFGIDSDEDDAIPIIIGHTYRISFDLTTDGGGVWFLNGITDEDGVNVADGTYQGDFVAASTQDFCNWFQFNLTSSTTATLSNVSVREVTTL